MSAEDAAVVERGTQLGFIACRALADCPARVGELLALNGYKRPHGVDGVGEAPRPGEPLLVLTSADDGLRVQVDHDALR